MREYETLNHIEQEEIEFDNRNLAPIEEIGIGSTPLGFKSTAEVSDYIKKNPERLFVPSFVESGTKSVEEVDQARRRKKVLSSTSLFNPEFTVRLWKQGLRPAIDLSPLDAEGKVLELRVGIENPITGDFIRFTEQEREQYEKEIREDLLEILTPSGVDGGLIILKSNLRKETEDVA